MTAKARITAVVCTYNGANRIARTIDSLVKQTLPRDDYEILVVDNASTDGTAEVVDAFGSVCRRVFEPLPGLSMARNRALSEAMGEVVAFIDDDATAMPAWLQELVTAFDESEVIGAGGLIELVWPAGSPPRWYGADLAGFFSGVDHGRSRIELSAPDYPFGTNMAVRRELAIQIGGFRTDLGRLGSSLISFEEYEFFERLSVLDGDLVYLPDAEVHHHVDEGRVSVRWLLRRARYNGKSQVLMSDANRWVGREALFGLEALARSVAYFARGLVAAAVSRPRAPRLALDLAYSSHWAGVALATGSRLMARAGFGGGQP